jgi:hypothetical protein
LNQDARFRARHLFGERGAQRCEEIVLAVDVADRSHGVAVRNRADGWTPSAAPDRDRHQARRIPDERAEASCVT